jgi:alpha-ketoglutarate-dependent taurine dioxygenase
MQLLDGTFKEGSWIETQISSPAASHVEADTPFLPYVLEATEPGIDLAGWTIGQRERLEGLLALHGAILFRNFEVRTAGDLDRVIRATSNGPLEYKERTSPRSTVEGKIYTSTDYPAGFDIFPHSEHSYSLTFPLRLYFCCIVAPATGGETPIADNRRILNRLGPSIREKFVEKSWMYVRNFSDGFGLSWRNAFQTDDPAIVEDYCRSHGIEWQWNGQKLRTRQIRPALAQHPRTGEWIWFNHATFFHLSTLDDRVRRSLQAAFQEADLPNNTYYGDGSTIENEVLDDLRRAYLEESVLFRWRLGDVLMLDNMLAAHARKAYTGERKILVGMADPYTRQDVALS